MDQISNYEDVSNARQCLSGIQGGKKIKGLFGNPDVSKSKRDKEALQKRIVELEAELKGCNHEPPPDQEDKEVCFPKGSLLIKMKDSNLSGRNSGWTGRANPEDQHESQQNVFAF